MNQITLTDRGKEILTGFNTNEQYWVGYFGLAYVPVQNTVNPETDKDEGLESLSTLVGDQEKGDYIYNIWQGDLTGGGYRGADADFTRLTQYDANLSTNFRYAYDSDTGCNRLVTWTTAGKAVDGESAVKYDSYDREGYRVYSGCAPVAAGGSDTDTVTYSDSDIPVPAPLIYLGAGLGYDGGMAAMKQELGPDWPLTGDGYPMVTPDMRCYSGKPKESELTDGDIIESEDTRTDSGTLEDYNCFVSISNYNKGHAQVSSEGYETDYQESCHNMSRVTKLFPIARYEVTDVDPETKESRSGNAKSIKYHISLDFGGDNREYRKVLNFEGSEEPVFAENPNNSFKFNRVGIYAVPVSVRKFRKEGQAGCNHCQVEVDPDENPVLVAIISLDEVMLSEDGSMGFTRWTQDFILNLENATGDGGCVRDVEVYYNMAENEAITWYQNQLMASAGLSEAVTALGVDVAYLKNRAAAVCGDCYTSADTSSSEKYASIYHTHDYLKNLVDAEGTGSVKGIHSAENTGSYSLSMGASGNSNEGSFSINVSATGSIHNGSSDSASGVLMMSAGGPDVYGLRNSAVLIDNGNVGSGRGNLIAGAAYNLFNTVDTIREITLSDFNASVNDSGISTLTPGEFCILSEAGGSIKVWDPDNTSGYTKNVTLVPGPTSGKYYGIRVSTVSDVRRPIYEPTTVDGVNAEYAYMVPSNVNNVLNLGTSNGLASNTKNTVLIGDANISRFVKLTNTLIIGDSVLRPGTKYQERFDGMGDSGPNQLEISGVTVMGSLSPDVLGDLASTASLATNNYYNSHIFLDNRYASPEMFGIFSNPLDTGKTTWGAYFPLDDSKFDGSDIYWSTEGSPDMWANGLPRAAVHGLINSATAVMLENGDYVNLSIPMIYTGGICLAGQPNSAGVPMLGEPNAGRIKLGSGVLPSAYIAASGGVSSWFGNGNSFIIPTTITGTTSCPYGGMLLGVTDYQEVDGTMHIGLFKYPDVLPPEPVDGDEGKVLTVDIDKSVKWASPGALHGLTTTFVDTIVQNDGTHDSGDPSKHLNVQKGKRYIVKNSSYIIMDMSTAISDGDEFILVIENTDGSPAVYYTALDAVTLTNPIEINRGSWICRAATQVASDSSTTTRGLIISPIGNWQPPKYDTGDDGKVLNVESTGKLAWSAS